MDCLLAIVLLVFGIVLVSMGKVALGANEARGPGVRIAGVVLILYMPLYFGAALLWGMSEGLQAGPGANQQQLQQKLQATAAEYWWVGFVWAAAHVLLALILVMASVKPKERTRWDEDDDRYPRRRSRRTADRNDDDRDGRDGDDEGRDRDGRRDGGGDGGRRRWREADEDDDRR